MTTSLIIGRSSQLEVIHIFKEGEESQWKRFMSKYFTLTEIQPATETEEMVDDDDLLNFDLNEPTQETVPDSLTQTQDEQE